MPNTFTIAGPIATDVLTDQPDQSDQSAATDQSVPPKKAPRMPFKNAAAARSSQLSPRQQRKARQHHEAFAAALAARLSVFLRADFALSLAGLELLPYQSLTENWPDPAHLTLFKTEPWRGVSILQIPIRLALSIVDRLMGGSGQPGPAGREMGAIENALLEQAAQVVAAEWCAQAAPIQELKPVLLGHESSARYLQTAPPQTPMLVAVFDAALADCRELIQIAFPFAALEPWLRQLAAELEPAPAPAPPPAQSGAWNPSFDEVPVTVTGIWAGLDVSARQMLNLKVGDVLRLDGAAARQIELRLGGQPKFHGRPGLAAGHWAVELTDVVKH
jgi:flagellar motor switch protein FliM